MEKIKFTDELLKTLYNRSFEIVYARHGVHIDYIKICDGYLEGVETNYRCGDHDEDTYYISCEDLNDMNLDALVAKREEEKRIQREKLEADRKRIEAERLARELREERSLYEKLRQKYENS